MTRPLALPSPAQKVARAKPFLKWAGGKTQLLPALLQRFPAQYGRYYEPFLGGGAVFFGLGAKRATLSDINLELMETYQAIRDHVTEVIDALERYQSDADVYYRERARKPTNLSLAKRAARVIYLNRTCFNGLYRVNRDGQFNVPFGRYANPTICHHDNLNKVCEALSGVTLRCQPVSAIARQARRGDLVYFDPPYVPVSATANFVHYTERGFGAAEQIKLADLFCALAARGVYVVLSNSDTAWVRKLYQGFRIESVLARRAINRDPCGRGPVRELIITAGPAKLRRIPSSPAQAVAARPAH